MVAALRIPVISNGNTACHADVAANLAATGAAGVMSGEGVLSNPLLFETTPRGGGEGGGGEGGGGEGGGGEGGEGGAAGWQNAPQLLYSEGHAELLEKAAWMRALLHSLREEVA